MKVEKTIQAINEPFWTADGSSNSAQLLIAGQPMFDPSDVNVSALWQTNWQGTQQLFSFARTQYFANSTFAGTVAGHTLPIGWAVDGTGSGLTLTINSAGIDNGAPYIEFRVNGTATGANWVLRNSGTFTPTGNQAERWTTSARVKLIAGTVTSGGFSIRTCEATGSFLASITNLTLISGQYVNGASTRQVALTTAPMQGRYVFSFPSGEAVDVTIRIAGPQLEKSSSQTSFIASSSGYTTQTDFSTDADEVDFGYVPVAGSTFTWSGTADVNVLDATATILAQYANSPTITALIDYMNQWLDPTACLDEFYNLVWNVETAQGVGLDIWGRIVDIPRTIQLTPPNEYFGFETSVVSSFYPFNNRPFYSGPQHGTQYTLSDDAYRILIMTKALANISSFSAPSVNALLRYLFAGRGSCYALDLGGTQMQYVFNFALQPWEASVIQQPQLMPRPAGVGVTITVIP